MTDTQLKKLKTSVKNKTEATLRMSLKMFNGNYLPHELLLTAIQKTKLRTAFNNNMSTDLKLSRVQFSKIVQSGGFLVSLLSKLGGRKLESSNSFSKKCFGSIRNNSSCFNNWCRNSRKIHGSGTTTLIISNEEMNDIMKIVLNSWRFYILLKGATKTIKNETKEHKGVFLSMLLGTLGASLSGTLLAGNRIVRTGSGNKKGK